MMIVGPQNFDSLYKELLAALRITACRGDAKYPNGKEARQRYVALLHEIIHLLGGQRPSSARLPRFLFAEAAKSVANGWMYEGRC
jgi:hypothetical protein